MKESLKLLFNGIYLKTQISKISDANQVYLFDEGVLQYLWAIYLRSNCPLERIDLQTICDFFCTPEQVISIEADAETTVKRINSRNEFVSIMESSDLERRVKEMQDIQHKIVSFAVENGIQVICYDNN